MADNIGSTPGTAGSIAVGNMTINSLETIGDHDWFRINLVSGQAITVSLRGVTLQDPYLRILDSNGVELYFNDDSGADLDSLLSFAANLTNPNAAGYNPTGVFYIDVGAFGNQGAGDYQLTVTAFQTPPVFTNDQIANQLARGYWDGTELRFNVSSGGSLTVNLTGLTGSGLSLARSALQTWSEITGITFIETSSATPNILFTEDEPDAFTEILTENGTFVTSMHVNIETQWLVDFGSTIGTYGYMTYMHEIGHALGLGHAGNYNTTATYPYDALFQNDSWATSVMSYFDQTESTYFQSRGFNKLHLVTPMVADILAMQQLYGLSTTTRSGDTTYGFNSNAGGVYDASVYPVSTVAYTIFDTGGIDTLDYSNTFTGQQLINLNPETFSNIAGRTGNVTIARGTIIENAIGSDSRPDTIIGNSANNTLTGGGHNDTLTGGVGADTFLDSLAGLSGDTIMDFSAEDRIVFTDATLATFTFNLTGSTLTYSGGSLTLSAPVNGTIVASAAAGGGVQLSITVTPVRNAGDFNGDNRDDVLLRHDSGTITEWLGQANGGFFSNHAIAAYSLDVTWQVAGTGDFNGDGRDDVLLKHDNGAVTDWLGQADGSFISNHANASYSLPSGWHVVTTGDFNGDTRADILLRHDGGTITNWLGQPNGSFFSNHAVAAYALDTSWVIAGTGDFNGDLREDLILVNANGSVTNWLGQANGTYFSNHVAASYALPVGWQILGVGDFNGDNRDDLLLRHDNGTITNWLAQANGTFFSNHAAVNYSLDNAWQVAAVGDFNGDGRDDLLLRHQNGTVTNWLGQASGTFFSNHAVANYPLDNAWSVQPDDLWV